MGNIADKFRRVRLDQTPYLFHFTKGTIEESKDSLFSILDQDKLISKYCDYICFSASPITSIHKFFETKVNSTNLPMYQPFGIGFSRDLLIKEFGARNVIYCDEQEGKFNIEVQSVDRYNLNNLYLKTPEDQRQAVPLCDFARQRRLAMHKKEKRENAFSLKSTVFALLCTNI